MATVTASKRPKRLRSKVSDFLEDALEDLIACEEDPHYKIEMGCWHAPKALDTYDRNGNSRYVCQVCLGGATMAQTLKCHPLDSRTPASLPGVTDATQAKLYALDSLRQGYIADAFEQIGRQFPKGVRGYIPVASYAENPTKFKNDMRKIIRILRKAGA